MSDTPNITAALSDRYVIEREIGSGGMAVVYLARDRKLDREVALKVLRPELGAVLGSERFLAEIKISARLDHPHILTLIDSGEIDGLLYYVLPFVRGESLRGKLDREKQLGLDEALTITKQVASALDYAHRQGLVHRDIKPENILIQEGEAMLTDFGIALAVKEAGGNRLTQTGLSLGTPQYMSPEQATGDRGIDARSDVYSLASVLYEMLAGEPPVTGASAQSMIAKLMTERPTHLRVLRDTVPPAVDEAVSKALAKTPADRFASAGDFARALDARPAAEAPHATAAPGPRRRTSMLVGVAAIALAAIAVGGVYAMRARKPAHVSTAVLGQKTQLTLSGNVLVPAISPDGKQLAYVVKTCASEACTFSVVVQDVGGSTTRSVLDGASSIYYLEWSPDRRNMEFQGTMNGRAGTYLLSALGGPPKFLTAGFATFFAGGDSLLLGPPYRPDSTYWIRVAGLDGVPRDSFHVDGVGQGVAAISSMPGTDWIVSLVLQQPHGLWQVTNRHGKVIDHVVNACTCGGVATSDAVWLSRAGGGTGESIVRIAMDRATGKLATHQDTMATGLFTNFSLTSDGAGMVMDEGTFDFNVYALDMADVVAGRVSESHRVAQASNPVDATVSPDGARLLLQRRVPIGGGHAELRFSLMPFGGGTETPLPIPGSVRHAIWSDSVTVAVALQTPGGLRLAEVDVRSGAQRNAMDLPDSTIAFGRPLRDGWAWIPASGDRINVKRGGTMSSYPEPKWYAFLYEFTVDAANEHVYISGQDRATGDSMGVSAISLADGSSTPWMSMVGEYGSVRMLGDGSLFLVAPVSAASLSYFKLAGPGKVQHIGTSSRYQRLSVSSDMKRGTVQLRDYRADAWLSKVIRQ